eukprot:70504-Amorphochlora_amoeboformis.AAC.1
MARLRREKGLLNAKSGSSNYGPQNLNIRRLASRNKGQNGEQDDEQDGFHEREREHEQNQQEQGRKQGLKHWQEHEEQGEENEDEIEAFGRGSRRRCIQRRMSGKSGKKYGKDYGKYGNEDSEKATRGVFRKPTSSGKPDRSPLQSGNWGKSNNTDSTLISSFSPSAASELKETSSPTNIAAQPGVFDTCQHPDPPRGARNRERAKRRSRPSRRQKSQHNSQDIRAGLPPKPASAPEDLSRSLKGESRFYSAGDEPLFDLEGINDSGAFSAWGSPMSAERQQDGKRQHVHPQYDHDHRHTEYYHTQSDSHSRDDALDRLVGMLQ